MTFDPSQYGNISDADLDSMAASKPQSPSFNPADYDHISDSDLAKVSQPSANKNLPASGSLGEQALRQVGMGSRDLLTMATGASSGIGDIANSGVNAATSALNKYAGTNIPQLGSMSGQIQKNLTQAGLPEPQNEIEQAGVDVSNILGGIATGVKNPVGAVRNIYNAGKDFLSTPEISGALSETAAGELPKTTYKTPEFDPVDILRSHGSSQAAASNVNGVIGDSLRTMAGNSVGYAPTAKSSIEELLDQAQNGTEPMKNRAQVVKSLTHTLDQFDENGNMPVKAALDLKVLANQNYKSGQNLYTGAWGDVRDAADSVLSDHAIDNPEFGQMLHLQRIHNANDVGEAYNNNETLQKMFGKDDLKNISDYDSGTLRDVGTDTQKSANSIVSKIKTPEDYNAVVKGIDDPQVLRQLNDAVMKNILPSRGQYLWDTMKSAGNFKFADALENFGKTFIPKLGLSDDELGVYNAIKANEITPTRYSVGQSEAKTNDIMSKWQNRINSIPSEAVPLPKTVLSLPAPNINVPQGGFYQGESQGPLINYNSGQRALPAPREMSYEDMVKSGRILPPKGPDFLSTSSGQVYKPGDVPPLDNLERKSGGRIGSYSHKTWAKLVREHGKEAKVKMSHLKDESARERLLNTAARLTNK